MTSGVGLDRDALHAFLLSKAGRNGKLLMKQKEFASEFGMSPYHLSRVVQEFVADGRLKLLGVGHKNVKTYVVKSAP